MKKKQIYLHIGTTKTGTTSIQNFLMRNQALLKKKNYIVYTPNKNSNSDSSVYGMRMLIDKINATTKRAYPDLELNQWMSGFIKKIKAATADNIILSEELVWNISGARRKHKQQLITDFITRLKEFAEVTLIVYLRRQDYYIMSSYQQVLKAGNMAGETCQQWIKRKRNSHVNRFPDYKQRLKQFIEIVGRPNIIVRAFESGQFFNNSLIDDFMQSIGLKITAEYDISVNKRNPGLSPFMAEIVRCLTVYNRDKSTIQPFLNSKNRKNDKLFNQARQHNFLSPADRRSLILKYSQSNRWVAKEFFGSKDGILFHEPLPEADATWQNYTLNPDDVKNFFTNADFLDQPQQRVMQQQVLNALKRQKIQNIKLFISRMIESLLLKKLETWSNIKRSLIKFTGNPGVNK